MASTPTAPRLLLINPRQAIKHYSTQAGMVAMLGKANALPPLSLALLAAHTPRHYRVRIVDEEAGPLPEGVEADLVGITALSNTIERAYALADRFRARGVTVVLGGPHATYAPDEAEAHADALVLGEAEALWPRLLADFEASALEPRYQAEARPPYTQSPPPRWDLIDPERYLALPLQASRGCPHACEFCLVTQMFGKKVRLRGLDDVEAELRSLPLGRVFFVDDNLTINRRFARELCSRLADLPLSWSCQASIELGRDPELLEMMAEAGCDQVLIGFESLNPASLAETHKLQNRRADYREAIAAIHGAGIHVMASFVVGFDHDGPDELSRIVDFCEDNALIFVALNLLGSSPGTRLHQRLCDEGRLCQAPNELRGGMFPVIRYRGVGQLELFDRYHEAVQRLYRWQSLHRRAVDLFSRGAFTRTPRDQSVGTWQKVALSARLTGAYLLSGNPHKRRLFRDLWSMTREGRLAVERLAPFLLSLEGNARYLAELAARRDELRARVEAYATPPA